MYCGCPYVLPHSPPFAEGSKAGAPTPRHRLVSLPCWYQGRYLICPSPLLSVFYYIYLLPFSSVLFFVVVFFFPNREGGFPSYCPLPSVPRTILGSKCTRAYGEGLSMKITEYTSHIGKKKRCSFQPLFSHLLQRTPWHGRAFPNTLHKILQKKTAFSVESG